MANLRKLQQEIKQRTAHIRPDPRPQVSLAERDHLHELFLRLVKSLYDYPSIEVDEMVRAVPLRLSATENQFLSDRLSGVRRKQNLVVVSRDDEDVLLPLRSGFDPRKVPLAAAWTDGGFYTARERAHSNSGKLRKLGLRDGIAGYASYRVLLLNPPVGRPIQVEPQELTKVTSSYEAEAVAVELALHGLIARLEGERNLPPPHELHFVIFSDCQSLITALQNPPASGEEASAETLKRVRDLAALFAGFYPHWEERRRIKARLGH